MGARLKKLLLVTTKLTHGTGGGRQLLSSVHYDILFELYADRLLVHELGMHLISPATRARAAIQGYLDGVTSSVAAQIVQRIQTEGVSHVFLDGSNLGALTKVISRQCPEVVSLTFFHNIEAQFFWGALRHHLSPKTALLAFANFLAERTAVRHSDVLICLNDRDSLRMKRLYGRGADEVSPMTMQDRRPPPGMHQQKGDESDQYLLFVGGAFYANEAGIRWFCRRVSPLVPVRTVVVGRGLGKIRAELESFKNVQVVGEADSLAPWYENASLVVAPVFDGSGMKTKVAEALMFGKHVIGTKEAFTGYEAFQPVIGPVCETPEEFVAAITDTLKTSHLRFNPALRKIYEQHFSVEAARERFERILLGSSKQRTGAADRPRTQSP